MSRKSRAKSDRSPDAWSKAAKRGADTAAAGSQPSIGWTILFAALALVVSAVFFAQLVNPAGFLAAITQADMARLERNQDAGVAPNWDTLFASLREELRRQPTSRRHEAVARLIAKLIDVERGKADAATASTEADALLAEDADNLLSRVACAAIGDEAAAATTRDAVAIKADALIARFQTMEKVFVGERPARESRLYNKEYDEAWFAILRKGVSRLDVASNLAKYIRHYEIREHYAALPMIQRRLGTLADELDAAGHSDEARRVRRWLVQLFVGLMRSEPDAGTRLLCADMLGRTLAGSEPQLAERMAALRREYHAAADAAPVNLTDPARSPSSVPSQYRDVAKFAAMAMFFAVAGLGASVILLFAASTALVARIWKTVSRGRTGDGPSRSQLTMRNWTVRWALTIALFAALTCVLIVLSPMRDAAMYSEGWGYHALACALATGSMIVILRAAFTTVRPERAREDRARSIAACCLAVIPIALIVLPPKWLAWSIRWVDLWVPSIILLSLFLFVVVSAAYRVVHVPARWMAASAVATWMIAMVFAYPTLLAHEYADWMIQHAQRNLLEDEFGFRMGDYWESRFLTDIAKAYDIPS
ncbi:MAG: hypothetical protein HS101_03690 [Planctomycetia bacterium]|nr:hypothetical protein [Planctomycetia bacterium]MCC7316033.1 hypothetical protein [Planctomycetota bacterium]OQZ06152.1 MAG: hypothetical protein B6D36_06455 [Planctomycetes bacterium UTPLA1]